MSRRRIENIFKLVTTNLSSCDTQVKDNYCTIEDISLQTTFETPNNLPQVNIEVFIFKI